MGGKRGRNDIPQDAKPKEAKCVVAKEWIIPTKGYSSKTGMIQMISSNTIFRNTTWCLWLKDLRPVLLCHNWSWPWELVQKAPAPSTLPNFYMPRDEMAKLWQRTWIYSLIDAILIQSTSLCMSLNIKSHL